MASHPSPPPVSPQQPPQAPVFLLSAPRSGSTLLRAMLDGHPQLFAPQELHLLGFADLAERKEALGQAGFLALGLAQALAGLAPAGTGRRSALRAASKQINEWLAAGTGIGHIYTALQTRAAPRVLVDKTPSYAAEAATLERGRALFPQARYLHLVRTPQAVIDSILRIQQRSPLMRDHVFQGAVHHAGDAETVWYQHHLHIEQHLSQVPAHLQLQIHYRALVERPEPSLRRICDWLALPFDPAMLAPYAPGRSTQALSIGDPDFRSHSGIEPGLADRWRGGPLAHHRLRPETADLARRLGFTPA